MLGSRERATLVALLVASEEATHLLGGLKMRRKEYRQNPLPSPSKQARRDLKVNIDALNAEGIDVANTRVAE